jgi:hypothetical protein
MPRSCQTVIVRAVTPGQDEGPHCRALPKANTEAMVDILRAAAGLPPLYGEHDGG